MNKTYDVIYTIIYYTPLGIIILLLIVYLGYLLEDYYFTCYKVALYKEEEKWQVKFNKERPNELKVELDDCYFITKKIPVSIRYMRYKDYHLPYNKQVNIKNFYAKWDFYTKWS